MTQVPYLVFESTLPAKYARGTVVDLTPPGLGTYDGVVHDYDGTVGEYMGSVISYGQEVTTSGVTSTIINNFGGDTYVEGDTTIIDTSYSYVEVVSVIEVTPDGGMPTDMPPVAPVPLPASAVLLVAALGSLAYFKRRYA